MPRIERVRQLGYRERDHCRFCKREVTVGEFDCGESCNFNPSGGRLLEWVASDYGCRDCSKPAVGFSHLGWREVCLDHLPPDSLTFRGKILLRKRQREASERGESIDGGTKSEEARQKGGPPGPV